MTTINNFSHYESKPGSRHNVVREIERKENELRKYLNKCQLYKRINPETHPVRSELLERMYEEKKVMRNRTCRRNGAKGFNFKKESALKVISNNRFLKKDKNFETEIKGVDLRYIEDRYIEENDEE